MSLISSDEHGVRWLHADCPVCGDQGPHHNSWRADPGVWQCFMCSATFSTDGVVLD
jgi:ribosomal protein L37AE/L43A